MNRMRVILPWAMAPVCVCLGLLVGSLASSFPESAEEPFADRPCLKAAIDALLEAQSTDEPQPKLTIAWPTSGF